MKRSHRTRAICLLCVSFLGIAGAQAFGANDEEVALKADRSFAQAAAKADGVAMGELLDADFSWTDAAGKALTRAQVLAAPPVPSISNETDVQRTHRNYADVVLIQARDG